MQDATLHIFCILNWNVIEGIALDLPFYLECYEDSTQVNMRESFFNIKPHPNLWLGFVLKNRAANQTMGLYCKGVCPDFRANK